MNGSLPSALITKFLAILHQHALTDLVLKALTWWSKTMWIGDSMGGETEQNPLLLVLSQNSNTSSGDFMFRGRKVNSSIGTERVEDSYHSQGFNSYKEIRVFVAGSEALVWWMRC